MSSEVPQSPKPSVLFIFAEGLEELEAVAPLDILRRAGAECTVASLEAEPNVTGRNGIHLRADVSLDAVKDHSFDLVVIPGGPGVAALRKDERVLELLRRHFHGGQLVAAICAGPTVLQAAGLLEGKRSTAHSSVIDEIPGATPDEAVVEDDTVITSRGAGTAIAFGLVLARRLAGPETTRAVEQSIHYDMITPAPH